LESYVAARKDALALLSVTSRSGEHSELFRTTEAYRAGGEGKAKADHLLAATYGLLSDLLALISGAPELVRNTDILGELKSLAAGVDFLWLARAAQELGRVQSGARRNVLRSLSLDALALSLER
ncbi:MAG: DNA polymerase III subunit delta', partial [Candidatus Angelobacter sp.]